MGRRVAPVLLILAGSMGLGGCVDEDVVFDDRPIYQRVASLAGGFVGYSDPSDGDKLTVCGQCHAEYQAQWEMTGHAEAWAGLQESDHAQAFCEACHSVNSLGNVVEEDEPGVAQGGHAAIATEDGRYLDVQCESCHGPGLDHVLDPGNDNVPLAPLQTGSALTFGCGECHSGFHHPFVEEWEGSPHGNVTEAAATAGPDEGNCYSCHSGEGALQRFGVTADYLDKSQLLASDDHFAQITCAVCHDPHDAQYEGQLRFPVQGVQPNDHLCGQCHDRHSQPDTDALQDWLTPHSPATDLLAGSAGWFPPGSGLTPGATEGVHGLASNDRLCASCHVVQYEVSEPDGGPFQSVGHGFRAIPCVDDDGLPTDETGCALTTEARSFEGCLECHDSEQGVRDALVAEAQALLPLVEQLAGYLDQIDGNGPGPGGPIDGNAVPFTVAEGAFFNLTLAGGPFPALANTPDRIRALAPALTHNPTLLRPLIEATLDAVEAEYATELGLSPAVAVRGGS